MTSKPLGADAPAGGHPVAKIETIALVASLKEAEGDGTWFTEGQKSLYVAVEPGFCSPDLDVVG